MQQYNLPANISDKVFDLHTKAKRSGTKGETPSGLAFPFAGKYSKYKKGESRFGATVGQGTTFYVSLPKAVV